MTPAQVRMARAGLGWSVEELAGRAGIAPEELANLEKERFAGEPGKLSRLKKVLEAAGVAFTDDGAPGVALRPHARYIPTSELNSANDG